MITLFKRDLYPDLRSGYQQWVSSVKEDISNILKWRYLRLYFVVLAVIYILAALWLSDYQVLSLGIPLLIAIAYLFILKREMPLIQQVMWILFGIGLAITLFVEVFVLKGDAGRSNTVFRFYNQVWFIFGFVISLALMDLLTGPQNWSRSTKYTWGVGFGLLLLFAASYPLIATDKKITDRWPDILEPPHALDGALYMLGDAGGLNPAIYNDDNRPINLSHDYSAILYMQDHISGSPVFVEGHTEEYRWGSRFSIYTGLPSVVGWSWHVRQHNSLLDGAIVDRLIDDVNNFYNTADEQAAMQFLEKHQVQFIVVGDLERAYYDANGLAKFEDMVDRGILKIVFGDASVNTTTIYEVVEVKR
jgi:uncharacterized membrane protein